MVFRQGDNVLIRIGRTSYISLSLEDRIKLEGIVLDQEEESAWLYLNEIVRPRIKEIAEDGEDPIISDIRELDRIIKTRDVHSALRYVGDVIYKRVVEYINRPACKPAFELPKGEDMAQIQLSAFKL